MKRIRSIMLLLFSLFCFGAWAQKTEVGLTSSLSLMNSSGAGRTDQFAIGLTGNHSFHPSWKTHMDLSIGQSKATLGNKSSGFSKDSTSILTTTSYRMGIFLSREKQIARKLQFYPLAGIYHGFHAITDVLERSPIPAEYIRPWFYSVGVQLGGGLKLALSKRLYLRCDYRLSNYMLAVEKGGAKYFNSKMFEPLNHTFHFSLTIDPFKA